jgi:transposase
MIAVTPHMRILIAVEPVDFRKGIDGLAAVCKNILDLDPFSGYLFVFTNRKRTSIKMLVYDGQGFWLAQKRLSSGRFRFWPGRSGHKTDTLEASGLYALIWNGDPSLQATEWWKKIPN